MGLMSFLSGVGEKLFPSSEKEPEVKAAALLAHVQSLNLPFKKLSVKVVEDAVTLSGEVAEQVDSEKIAIAVGNVAGVASVDNQIEVEEPKEEAQYHTVVSGDTLGGIAKAFYGNAMKYPVIFEANKPMLSNPDRIYPGQVLRIPALEA